MSTLEKDILQHFGDKLRIRVCGLHIQDQKLLLVKHQSVGKDGTFWAPPGGGMHFGETSAQALLREMKEETGLEVRQYEFAFVHEFIDPPLHAIELFFEIHQADGLASKGHDPEMHHDRQLIEEIRYMTLEEIHALPEHSKHQVLVGLKSFDALVSKRGYSIFNPKGI